MERKEIVSKLTSVFRTIFNDNTLILSDELTANDVDNWDSLSHMILITEIEKSFSIKFKLKDLNKMRNVGDMIEIIMLKLQPV
jgi:acyl carrier protein